MTVFHQHHREPAGASFTKAVAILRRGSMDPVAPVWNKHRAGADDQA